jgi:hypothetical protein
MRNRRIARVATLGAATALLGLSVGSLGLPSSDAAYTRSTAAPVHKLANTSRDIGDALTVTTKGVAVAVWPSGPDEGAGVVHAAVRRPGHRWSAARRLGHVDAESRIQAVRLPGGGVAAAWFSPTGVAVTRLWHPHTGWSPVNELSGPGYDFAPTLASNPAADTWAVGISVPGSVSGQQDVEVVVHSDGHQTRTVVATNGCGVPRLAIDDAGDIAAVGFRGTGCPHSLQAGLLPAGTTTWTTQEIAGCDTPDSFGCPELDPFQTAHGLALAEISFSQSNQKTAALWNVGDTGVWTQEPGDESHFIISDIISDRHGDLLTCARGRHDRVYVRPAGGDWKRIDLPHFRAEACAVDSHGRVVAIGNKRSGHHHFALMWGRIGQARFTHRRVLPLHLAGVFPRVVLRDSGDVFGLESADDEGALYAIHAKLSASASP